MIRPATRHALLFRAGTHDCAVPAEQVHLIVHMTRLLTSPGQPSILEGFLNLRGIAVPVVRLWRLFGISASRPSVYTPLIILECGGMLTALQVDSVDEVVEVEEASPRELGEGHSMNDCADFVFSSQGRDVVMLSCDLLLLKKEKEIVREGQAAAQQRLDALGLMAE